MSDVAHLDVESRKRNLYGVQILRCVPDRQVEIADGDESVWVLDFATNGSFGLNLRKEIGSIINKTLLLFQNRKVAHSFYDALNAR